MRKVLLIAAAVVMVLAAVTSVLTWANRTKKEIVGLTPEQVRWFTPSYYKDGRQRAQLFGDSSKAVHGSIESRYQPAAVSSPIHIHMTN